MRGSQQSYSGTTWKRRESPGSSKGIYFSVLALCGFFLSCHPSSELMCLSFDKCSLLREIRHHFGGKGERSIQSLEASYPHDHHHLRYHHYLPPSLSTFRLLNISYSCFYPFIKVAPSPDLRDKTSGTKQVRDELRQGSCHKARAVQGNGPNSATN